jgi:hypothetical protein
MRKPNTNPAVYAVYYYLDGSSRRFDFQKSKLTKEAASPVKVRKSAAKKVGKKAAVSIPATNH